jgi:hypothetical protein
VIALPASTRPPSRWKRLVKPLPALGMVGVVLMLASIAAYPVYETWAVQRGVRIAWDIVGPSCPVAPGPASAAFGRMGVKVFHYEGVKFERRFGHASCVAPNERGFMNAEFYRVCQFSAPETVRVTANHQAYAFKPGVGRVTTVKVRKGHVTCVVAGWFKP